MKINRRNKVYTVHCIPVCSELDFTLNLPLSVVASVQRLVCCVTYFSTLKSHWQQTLELYEVLVLTSDTSVCHHFIATFLEEVCRGARSLYSLMLSL